MEKGIELCAAISIDAGESPLMLVSSQQTGIHSKTFLWYWRDAKGKCSGEDTTFLCGL